MRTNLRAEMYYVYLYLREDRTPYYVGKGIGRRCYNKHIRNGRNFTPPKDRITIVKEFENEEESYEYEKWIISLYRRKSDGGILINLQDGGVDGNIIPKDLAERKKHIQEWNINYHRQYYKNNPNKQKEYREKRKEQRKETYEKWYEKNKEDYLKKRKEKYDKEKKREYYLKNKEEIDRKNMERYWKKKQLQNE